MGEKILILNLPKVKIEQIIYECKLKYPDLSDIFGKIKLNNYNSILLISDLDFEESFNYINLIGIYSEDKLEASIPCILFKYMNRKEIQNMICSEDSVEYIDIEHRLGSIEHENINLDLYMKLIGVNVVDFDKKKYYNIFNIAEIKKIINFIK